jgi:hypothetical protein
MVGFPVIYVLLSFLAHGNGHKWVAESMYLSQSECLQSLAKVQKEERDSSPPERKCVEYRPN